MPVLAANVLTPHAFAPYGEVFDPRTTTRRIDHVARLDNQRPDALPNLFLALSGIVHLPHRFDRLESHPWSSQSFAAFGPGEIVLAVALPGPDGRPDPATLRAFLAGGQGFSYRAGVWHLPVAGLGVAVPVMGFMYEDGSPDDCVWAEVTPFEVAPA